MPPGGIDDAARRSVGEAAAEHELMGVAGFDGGARQSEIALRDQAGERVAIGSESGARRIGPVGRFLLDGAALVRRIAPIGRGYARQRGESLPGLRGRLPGRVEMREIALTLVEPADNEPSVFTLFGSCLGGSAPGISDHATLLRVIHHVNLAHGAAVDRLRAEVRGASVGAIHNCQPCRSTAATLGMGSPRKHSMRIGMARFLPGRYPPLLADAIAPYQQPDLP